MKSALYTFLVLLLILSACQESPSPATEQTKVSVVSEQKETSISCDLIDNWKRAKAFTLQYLEAMPGEFYDFQPTPDILPFAHEFLHVACVNYRYAAMIAGGNDCSDYDTVYKDPNLQSRDQVIAFVMDSYDTMIARLMEEEDLSETTYYYRWTCSKECLALKGFEHQSHHRGKTAIYLRLKGIKPPSHMLIEDWTIPSDISVEDWVETNEYKSYTKIIDSE